MCQSGELKLLFDRVDRCPYSLGALPMKAFLASLASAFSFSSSRDELAADPPHCCLLLVTWQYCFGNSITFFVVSYYNISRCINFTPLPLVKSWSLTWHWWNHSEKVSVLFVFLCQQLTAALVAQYMMINTHFIMVHSVKMTTKRQKLRLFL